ncbi:hypothetical protein [Peribacillus butanolivorans]|uniref:hypothetical protein n=1 Tax=Peribacillus butanolivorans TaxID=421767 RepID=UPI0036825E0E
MNKNSLKQKASEIGNVHSGFFQEASQIVLLSVNVIDCNVYHDKVSLMYWSEHLDNNNS